MPTSSASPIRPDAHLAVDGVTAGYNAVPVIANVSVQVGMGEIVAVIGPNGSGKSTLLKSLVGEIRTMEGEVRLGGEDISHLRADELARRGVGYVPQTQDVFDPLTVAENLDMGGYLLRPNEIAARRDEVVDLLPALKTMLRRSARNLSGGERKMLAIARALMVRPTVLFLDEPTANLSPQLAMQLLHDHVTRLAERGVAVLLVEQRAAMALEIANWAYVLVAGKLRLAGPARDLLARHDLGEVFLGRDVTEPASEQSVVGG